jgi:hypothetical protein
MAGKKNEVEYWGSGSPKSGGEDSKYREKIAKEIYNILVEHEDDDHCIGEEIDSMGYECPTEDPHGIYKFILKNMKTGEIKALREYLDKQLGLEEAKKPGLKEAIKKSLTEDIDDEPPAEDLPTDGPTEIDDEKIITELRDLLRDDAHLEDTCFSDAKFGHPRVVHDTWRFRVTLPGGVTFNVILSQPEQIPQE